jgi:hypothetical protein
MYSSGCGLSGGSISLKQKRREASRLYRYKLVGIEKGSSAERRAF